MDSGRLQPALFGGLFIGVLSALPIVNAGELLLLPVGRRRRRARRLSAPAEFAVCGSRRPRAPSSGFLAGLIGGVLGVFSRSRLT